MFSVKWFTPTGVGTIAFPPWQGKFIAVHPHGRGDNSSPVRARSLRCGSPPRAWGQSRCGGRRLPHPRFTPTGVGTITYPPRRSGIVPVHPHGRGDNDRRGGERAVSHGSPPRAWGQYGVSTGSRHGSRFTPTGVGAINWRRRQSGACAVHPHGRGDNCLWSICGARLNGSPPRAWGQWRAGRVTHSQLRFTPTGVGTMSHWRWKCLRISVHPHGRGDNSLSEAEQFFRDGSPPRAWGQCRLRLM